MLGLERDVMDIETSDAIASLQGEITRVETTLDAKIGKLGADLRGEMAAMRNELIRHTDMRFESLRDDIRMVAEGFATLSAGQARILAVVAAHDARFDSLAEGQHALAARADRFAERQDALTARVDVIAESQEALTARVDRMAEGQEALTARVDRMAEGQEALTARVDRIAEGQEALTGRVDQVGKGQDAVMARIDRLLKVRRR
jgi:chromosome segregation ATPase